MTNMTNTNNADRTPPDLIAWDVHTRGEQTYWNRVGASWRHKDGKGMSIRLNVVPISGRIVLREPLEPREHNPARP